MDRRFKSPCWHKQSQASYRQLNQTIFDFKFWWNVQTESGEKRKERTGWINVKDRERLVNDFMPEGNNVRGEDYKKGEVHRRYLQTHYHFPLHNMVLYVNKNSFILLFAGLTTVRTNPLFNCNSHYILLSLDFSFFRT